MAFFIHCLLLLWRSFWFPIELCSFVCYIRFLFGILCLLGLLLWFCFIVFYSYKILLFLLTSSMAMWVSYSLRFFCSYMGFWLLCSDSQCYLGCIVSRFLCFGCLLLGFKFSILVVGFACLFSFACKLFDWFICS